MAFAHDFSRPVKANHHSLLAPLTTLVLSEEDGKTTIPRTILYPSKEARDVALQTGITDGLPVSFDRLVEHLRTMA